MADTPIVRPSSLKRDGANYAERCDWDPRFKLLIRM
jgi:hypothetical protein